MQPAQVGLAAWGESERVGGADAPGARWQGDFDGREAPPALVGVAAGGESEGGGGGRR